MTPWPWRVRFDVDFVTGPADTPSQWTDLTARLQGALEVSQGRGNDYCRLTLDNRDRALDPTNPQAPYAVQPMRHARVRVDVAGTTYPLFRGFVEDWPPVWPGYNQGMADVRLVGATAWLALQEANLDLPRQRTDQRIAALADIAGWPASLRDISPGVVTVEAHEQDSANLWRTMLDTAEAEDGELNVAPDGRLTFRSRHHRLNRDSQVDLGAGGLPVESVTPRFGGGPLVNVGVFELADGTVRTHVDESSVAQFGPRDMPGRDLPVPPVEAEGIAQWQVHRFRTPTLWLDRATVNCRDVGVLPQVLPRRIGDLAKFVHTPPGHGTAEVVGHIESVRHLIGPGTWRTTWDLSPYFGAGPWVVLDDPVLGLLDSDNKLAP